MSPKAIVTGDFDLFQLSMSKNLTDADRIVGWEIIHKKQAEVQLNIDSFEFPEVIKSLVLEGMFDMELIKNPDSENITLIGTLGNVDYEALLFDSQNGIPRPYNEDPLDIYTFTTKLFSAN